MTAIHPYAEVHSLKTIDRNFRPDLRNHLDTTRLESLAHLGIEPVGEPFPGQPGMRSALWYSRFPSKTGELAVIASVNPISTGVFKGGKGDTRWYVGCVPPYAQSTELTEDTLGSYAEFAEHATPTPAAAIVLAHILLRGPEEAAKEFLYYRAVD